MITAEELCGAIYSRCPELSATADELERIYRMQEVVSVLNETLRNFTKETAAALRESIEAGAVSDTYVICAPTRRFYTVDIDKAEKNLPEETFFDIVHLHPADAAKILTPKKLFALAVEKAGYERVKPLARITKEDLSRVVPAISLAEYLTEHTSVSAEKRVCRRSEVEP